ncbi:MAG: NYN domain-containing protein [Gammaproteobacteria bacterium]|nr:NYN domain-containing protein [Gammaproteobacteria bacterium]MDE0443494.1 NYN domain-containing protein [Gammaproteobacteria bacterium]
MTDRHQADRSGIAGFFRFRSRREQTRADLLLPPPGAAGVYVDIENLRNADHARTVIGTVVQDWPEDLPPVRRLCLYAPADKTGLWRAWGPGRFPELDVRVRGIQRFARESKNSADMAIVADAIADFANGTVRHVAVVSNDSDFGALFVKLQELASSPGGTDAPPFLWINLAGGSGLSREIVDFVPERLRWVVAPPARQRPAKASSRAENDSGGLPAIPTIVEWLLEEIPPGKFRAGDVLEIIRRHCPHHPAAQTGGACGRFLSRQLMPLLCGRGVSVVRQRPRTYERTN